MENEVKSTYLSLLDSRSSMEKRMKKNVQHISKLIIVISSEVGDLHVH